MFLPSHRTLHLPQAVDFSPELIEGSEKLKTNLEEEKKEKERQEAEDKRLEAERVEREAATAELNAAMEMNMQQVRGALSLSSSALFYPESPVSPPVFLVSCAVSFLSHPASCLFPTPSMSLSHVSFPWLSPMSLSHAFHISLPCPCKSIISKQC